MCCSLGRTGPCEMMQQGFCLPSLSRSLTPRVQASLCCPCRRLTIRLWRVSQSHTAARSIAMLLDVCVISRLSKMCQGSQELRNSCFSLYTSFLGLCLVPRCSSCKLSKNLAGTHCSMVTYKLLIPFKHQSWTLRPCHSVGRQPCGWTDTSSW